MPSPSESVRANDNLVPFPEPAPGDSVRTALDLLEGVYAFVFSRVGNRPDAEDLVQQVAVKALPRLREDAEVPAIRAYLYATARTVLAAFWANRFGIAEEELPENWAGGPPPPGESPLAATRVADLLERLPDNYRRVLELRFLRGYSVKETAAELGSTPGAIKVMQLRALRAAARMEADG